MDKFLSELPAKLAPLVTFRLPRVESDIWQSTTFWAYIFWILWLVGYSLLSFISWLPFLLFN